MDCSGDAAKKNRCALSDTGMNVYALGIGATIRSDTQRRVVHEQRTNSLDVPRERCDVLIEHVERLGVRQLILTQNGLNLPRYVSFSWKSRKNPSPIDGLVDHGLANFSGLGCLGSPASGTISCYQGWVTQNIPQHAQRARKVWPERRPPRACLP